MAAYHQYYAVNRAVESTLRASGYVKKDPVGMLLEEKFGTTLTRKKGVERAEFENGTVIVNHSSYPCRIDEPGTRYFQNPELYQDLDSKILLPHMGVFIERKV